MHKLSPIIKAGELLLLKDQEKLIIIDVRTGPLAKASYEQGHLAGALFANLDTDLADIKSSPADGGRHPLPTIVQFKKTLKNWGIEKESYVIVYDDKNASNAAARLWWMLRAVGITQVRVLDIGYDAAVKAGFPVSNKTEVASVVEELDINDWLLPLAQIDDVANAAAADDAIVIDVRDKIRFDGDKEPIDPIAGHIPGAVNIPFASNLDHEGAFLSPEKLKEKYSLALERIDHGKLIVHCGSGVTACHTLLAMDYAGMEIPKLYVGSWSEWSGNGRAIATK